MKKRNIVNLPVFLILLILGILWFLPFVWGISTSLKPNPETYTYPPRWIPKHLTFENYGEVLVTSRTTPITRAYINSLIVALSTVFLVLFVDSLTAYAFARLKFRGRDLLFTIIVASLLIPGQITIIPVFLLLYKIGWLDSYQALIIPALASPFGVFLLRQFMLSIPRDLEDAARIDGCNSLQVYYKIILPCIKPALSTLGIFTFLASWNSFLWPLIVMTTRDMMTLPVALQAYLASYNYMIEAGYILAAVSLAFIPPLIAFLIFGRYIVKGITLSGLKI